MFCGKCGARNADEDSFCISCGAPLRRGVTSSHSVPEMSHYGTVTAAQVNSVTGNWSGRVRQVMVDYFRSPIFLISVICYTLIQIMNLVGNSGGGLSVLHSTLSEMGMSSSDISQLTGSLDQTITGFQLISALPGILMAVGLWITFVSALNDSSDGVSSAGLTMIRVVQIVIGSLTGVALVFSLIGLAGMSSRINSDAVSSVVGMAILVVLVALVVVLVYYGLITSSLRKVIDTLHTGVPDAGVSMTIAVLQFIGGGFSLLWMLGSGITALGLLQCAMSIIWGVGICTYRSTIQKLEGEAYLYRKAVIHPTAAASAPVQKNYVPAWKRVQGDEN